MSVICMNKNKPIIITRNIRLEHVEAWKEFGKFFCRMCNAVKSPIDCLIIDLDPLAKRPKNSGSLFFEFNIDNFNHCYGMGKEIVKPRKLNVGDGKT